MKNWWCLGLCLSLLVACRTSDTGSEELGGDMSRLKSQGLAVISWPCSGTGKEFPPGKNSQEEYCEWTRTAEPFVGRGAKVGGDLEPINLPKACIFTTSFDQTRTYFLTKRTVGTDLSRSNPFRETFANSYAFLAGGAEPDSQIPRKGIIGHCIEGNSCGGGNCVANRASDPQICRALNSLGSKGCKVNKDFQVAPVITANRLPAQRHGDRIVKPQLTLRADKANSCWFVEDPKVSPGLANPKGESFKPKDQATLVACDAEALNISNCDHLAGDITAGVTLKIDNPSCVGGVDQPAPGPGVRTGVICKLKFPANAFTKSSKDGEVRFTLDTISPFSIRGFLGEFASITVKQGGKEFGAGVGTPTFVEKSSINAESCIRP